MTGPPSTLFSQDREWWWDGQEWRRAVSDDRRWIWDGERWQPIHVTLTDASLPLPGPPPTSWPGEDSGPPQAAIPHTPPSGSLPATPSRVEPHTPPIAVWALGLGIAALVAMFIAITGSLGVGDTWIAIVTVAFWLALLLSVLALIVGIPAHRRFRRSAGVLQGQEMVIGGWVGGLCAIVLAAAYQVLSLTTLIPWP